jgi:PAS domain S-box-containing protein
MQEGYFEVDFAGNFTFFNDSLCKFFDSFKEELMGMNYRQYTTDKEHSKKLFQTFNKVYSTGEPLDGFDWQIIRRDGTKRYIEASVSLQKDSSGKPIGFRGIARDVTERMQAQEALRASEELFRNYLEYAPDGVYTNELNGTFLYGNRKCEEIIGYKREELIGKNFLELNILPEKSLNKAIELLQLNMEGKSTGPDEIELISKEGRLIPVEINTSVVQRGGEGIVLSFVRDVTERKQAEKELKESENNYRLLADNIHDVIFVLDMDLNYTYISPSVKILRGYEPEELLNKTPTETLMPDSMDLAVRTLSKFMELEKSGHRVINESPMLQLEMLRKDGTTVWTEVKFSIIRDENQRPVSIMGVTRDITERRKSEYSLRDSEARLNLALETNNTGVWDLNLLDHTAFRTLIHDRIFGYETLLPKWTYEMFLEHVLPEDRLEVDRLFSEATAAQSDWSFECRVRRTDGEVRWIMATGQHMKNSKGKPVQMLGVVQDITERKQAEEALRNSEANYKQLFDNAPSAIYQVDFRTGKFLKANDVICKYFCCSQEEITSLSPYDLLTKESQILFLERLNKMAKGDQVPAEPEYEFVDKKGKRRWLKLNAKNIYDSEGLAGADVIAHDITDRKQAEEERQQTLERLKKAFGTIVQVMSSAVEAKDPYTAGHQLRVADLACAIATEMGLVQDMIEGIRMAGTIHDIGKLSIPAELLTKPTKLSNSEFSLIKEHALIGYEILKNVESPWPLAQIAYQHHERMNGSGYPRNLKGDEILMEARILAVADVVEAMASHRPYRAALGIDMALAEIEKNRETLYDKTVADVCLKLFREKGYQLT